ncbi:uncharacterized protein EURHEDRAFT_409035 [Aspergillus ruber CBS 135680]|uniref:Uncharacterized protein n=1 Tax=Aspergillus ruber (strain CBS 135680) TaxID=1388766 RepID=A0A017SQZ9_ASPRC|nr:uncharacterized protein EURHEDRAFT_409035 [Aspergillus ruber CBS 135680]EYE98695.1 hypothetical protein EURHEDRAFT_409035 [Aspergillus ruber CBS 135680]
MSYADAAARGAKQSPEDVRAPRVEAIYRDESENPATLVDVDSPHVSSVDPDFLKQNVKTSTQAERLQREQEQQTIEGQNKARKARAKAKAEKSSLSANKDNPVFVGNAVLLGLAGAGLGYGAYQKHLSGKLSWELVGLWSGAVGAFSVADYFVSKWLIQNKYPKK